jgi:hypothetical protein
LITASIFFIAFPSPGLPATTAGVAAPTVSRVRAKRERTKNRLPVSHLADVTRDNALAAISPGLQFEQFAYFVIIGDYPALVTKELTRSGACHPGAVLFG